jgi:hypothetical protein
MQAAAGQWAMLFGDQRLCWDDLPWQRSLPLLPLLLKGSARLRTRAGWTACGVPIMAVARRTGACRPWTVGAMSSMLPRPCR